MFNLDGIFDLIKYMAWLLIMFVPLGAWKAWELMVMLFAHLAWV